MKSSASKPGLRRSMFSHAYIDYPDPLSPGDGNLPIEPRLHRKSNNNLKFT